MNHQDDDHRVSRREFVAAGVAAAATTGLASRLQAMGPDDKKQPKPKKKKDRKKQDVLPTRALGRTGVKVTILEYGAGGQDVRSPRMFNAAYDAGIRILDTADCYIKGKHEAALGDWLADKGNRKDLLIVTKDHPKTPDQYVEMLDVRLKNAELDDVDLFFVHAIGEKDAGFDMTPEQMCDVAKSKEWAKAADRIKKSKKAKFTGFSLHGEMPVQIELLKNAAAGGWVDAIMLMYDPQLVRDNADFDKALDACHKAGVGLICMKSMRGIQHVPKFLPKFEELKLTTHQAVLHGIWSDERIVTVCSAMANLDILKENAAAARNFKPLDKDKLGAVIDLYDLPGRRFCPSCDGRCREAGGTIAALNHIVRYLSYYEIDGACEKARELYAALTPEQRDWHSADLAAASCACRSKLDFATLLSRAEEKLA